MSSAPQRTSSLHTLAEIWTEASSNCDSLNRSQEVLISAKMGRRLFGPIEEEKLAAAQKRLEQAEKRRYRRRLPQTVSATTSSSLVESKPV